jgi:hypothetical protein
MWDFRFSGSVGMILRMPSFIALRRAVYLAIASQMQVFFKTVEGQKSAPGRSEWLNAAARHFHEHGQRAGAWTPAGFAP